MWEDIILDNLMKSFFRDIPQAKIQIDNFNHMITNRLKKIIEDEVINIKLDEDRYFRINFDSVFVEKPFIIEDRIMRFITPMEARIRDLTYSGQVFCNINTCIVKHDTKTNEKIISEYKVYRKKSIAKIPIMLGSVKCNLHGMTSKEKHEKGECLYDQGGYFCIRGKERVLVSQERVNYNEVYCFQPKTNLREDSICEIRSISEETRHSVYLQMKMIHHKITITIPYIQGDIPLGYLFMAYGLNVEQVTSLFEKFNIDQQHLKYILLDMIKIRNKESAIIKIAENTASVVMKENRTRFVEQIIQNEILPHLGICSSDEKKIVFLAKMCKKLLRVIFHNEEYDCRDNINNKRLEMSGVLIENLFRTLFKRFIKLASIHLEKRQDIVVIMNKITLITIGIHHCFSTGSWGVPKSSFIRLGVSQILSRLTNASYLSHLLRVLVPIGKEAKNVKIRQVHCSSIGFYCPHETPEGAQSGIVKNLTPYCTMSKQYNITFVKKIITDIAIVHNDFDSFLHQNTNRNPTLVLLNGSLIGYTLVKDELWNQLHVLKSSDIFMKDVSISKRENQNEIHIFCDEGRLQRPLFTRKNLPSIVDLQSKSFSQLVMEKKIVYMDSYEIENHSIAMTLEELKTNECFDLLEIHPSLITGFSVALIPFPDHTQSPRITYHASMGKQAISLPFTNMNHRVDTINYLHCYPEKPIISSHVAQYNNLEKVPIGNNLCVAVSMYTGFNQEDSVIMNQSAIDRGLLRAFSYRTIVVEEKKKSTISSEKIEIPSLQIRTTCFNFSKVDENGIVKVGTFVGCGDVICCKVQKLSNKDMYIYKDSSVIVKSGEEGIVDNVYITHNTENYKIVKIKIRVEKIPEIGDKVASRNAQKGTISIILNEKDMPFSQETGMVPDLILNPLCLPSRMTINQLIESFLSKKSLDDWKKYYSTVFYSGHKEIMMKDIMHDENFENVTMVNGFTGETLKAKVFFGPTYYHRLKHLVSNKIHSRNNGKLQLLTRQPLEGRSRDGGLRMGEMERDCTISHGLSRFLRERLFEQSDYFELYVCANCGGIPHTTTTCNFCQKKNIVKIPLPFACKLLFQELTALGLKINIFTSKKKKISYEVK